MAPPSTRGRRCPPGERRQGTPAEQRTETDLQAVAPAPGSARRGATYAAMELVALLALYLPLAFGGAFLLATNVPPFGTLFGSSPADITTGTFVSDALIASLILVFGGIAVGLLVVGTVPRLLNLRHQARQGLPAVRLPLRRPSGHRPAHQRAVLPAALR